MKRSVTVSIIVLFAILSGMVVNVQASAFHPQSSVTTATPSPEDLISGALLYDRWYAVLGVEAPAGSMPIWSRQSSNGRSGADTWRCVECHGWDYKGAQGAYASGTHATGFPGIASQVSSLTEEEIVAHLKGANDQAHNFSAYMDDAALGKLAKFLKYGLIDDDQYIDDISLKVIDGNVDNGKKLFEQVCANCHGVDGKQIVFRTEGVNEYLGSVANRDPWRFLHRTRFGVAGVDMPVAARLGWSIEDGRDVLAYVQTLPVEVSQVTPQPGFAYEQPSTSVGGPPPGLFGGIFTGMGVFLMMGIAALIFIGALLGIGALVVWVLRKR
jgi:mono/diheme cytochrome c family protein